MMTIFLNHTRCHSQSRFSCDADVALYITILITTYDLPSSLFKVSIFLQSILIPNALNMASLQANLVT